MDVRLKGPMRYNVWDRIAWNSKCRVTNSLETKFEHCEYCPYLIILASKYSLEDRQPSQSLSNLSLQKSPYLSVLTSRNAYQSVSPLMSEASVAATALIRVKGQVDPILLFGEIRLANLGPVEYRLDDLC
jgi:hypothetical protein